MRNKVLINDLVTKSFVSEDCFFRELIGNKIFSNYFSVPKIINYSINDLFINYELINGHVLGVNELSIDNFKKLINKIRLIGLSDELFNWPNNIESILLNDYDSSFLGMLNLNDKTLIHGDLRHYNIIISDDDLFLIDFEFARNYVIEYDIAKFYVEAIAMRDSISDDLLSLAESFNYPNFLHSCLLIGYQQLFNSFYNKSLIKHFILEVKEEINNLIKA